MGRAGSSQMRVWSCRGVSFISARYGAHRYCPHFHDEFSIGLVLSGALGFRRGRAEFAAPAGRISAINPGEPHTGSAAAPGGWGALNLLVGPDELRRLLPEAFAGGDPAFAAPVIEDAAAARALLEAGRLTVAGAPAFEAEAALAAALGAVFLPHARAQAKPGAAAGAAVARAVEHMRGDLAGDLSLQAVAAAAGLSKFHFLRSFTAEMGITPHAYVVQLRLREARRLLAAGASLGEAAAGAGFADQSHFTRCFKRTVGAPPNLFLKAA